jgi:hypothetical protein
VRPHDRNARNPVICPALAQGRTSASRGRLARHQLGRGHVAAAFQVRLSGTRLAVGAAAHSAFAA